MSIKSQYPQILNALDEMQQSLLYAARRDILASAEQTIVHLENKVKLLEVEIQLLRKLMTTEPVGFVDAKGNAELTRQVYGGYLYHGDAMDPNLHQNIHWTEKNPGLADQYMNEAKACRSSLGFDPEADDVAPIDLVNKINNLKSNKNE